MFKGKKILFFSANFFGYQHEIKNKLFELGAEFDFFDERPKNTFLYKSLLFFGLIFKIIKFRINHQIILGISTILGSAKNSAKYFLTAKVVGASGVPKLTKRIPIFLSSP